MFFKPLSLYYFVMVTLANTVVQIGGKCRIYITFFSVMEILCYELGLISSK